MRKEVRIESSDYAYFGRSCLTVTIRNVCKVEADCSHHGLDENDSRYQTVLGHLASGKASSDLGLSEVIRAVPDNGKYCCDMRGAVVVGVL
jgi:hypothetical protein